MNDGIDRNSEEVLKELTDTEKLDAIQHFVTHARNYADAGLPVPGWVWERIRQAGVPRCSCTHYPQAPEPSCRVHGHRWMEPEQQEAPPKRG